MSNQPENPKGGILENPFGGCIIVIILLAVLGLCIGVAGMSLGAGQKELPEQLNMLTPEETKMVVSYAKIILSILSNGGFLGTVSIDNLG